MSLLQGQSSDHLVYKFSLLFPHVPGSEMAFLVDYTKEDCCSGLALFLTVTDHA